jgi:hypothetical protein
LATPEAIRFLERLLRYDHQERCTAKEAMDDVYFGKLTTKTQMRAAWIVGRWKIFSS